MKHMVLHVIVGYLGPGWILIFYESIKILSFKWTWPWWVSYEIMAENK